MPFLVSADPLGKFSAVTLKEINLDKEKCFDITGDFPFAAHQTENQKA